MGMSRIKTSGLAALIALASTGLAPSRADAGEVLNYTLKGTSLAGNFSTTQVIPCGTGQSTLYTFVSWNSSEGIEKSKSTQTVTTNTGVFVQQNNYCTGSFGSDFGFVQGGTITTKNMASATLSGTFPLFVSGGSLTLNVTLTSTGTVFNGLTLDRTNVGPTFFIQRSVSSSTSASNISGTVVINGQNLPMVNLAEVGGNFAKNNTGTLLVIGARTH
jgi:hypothetical protein